MKKALPIFALTFALLSSACGSVKEASQKSESSKKSDVAAQVQVMWDVSWQLFFSPKTNLFYDFISSYEVGKQFAHLPTAEETAALFPNTSGTGTGMEDCMIIAGLMLDAVVDRYAVEKDASLKSYADKVLAGIELCATVHNVKGFLVRGVSAIDGKSYYIGSSRDQFTQAIYGLWRYYNSPLCDNSSKARIKKIMAGIGELLFKYMTEENGYDYCLADGRKCPVGLSKMWNVQPHEAARLPMFYGAIYQVTGDERFYSEYRKFLIPAIEQSKRFSTSNPGWADMQMMMSLVLLYDLEQDAKIKADIKKIIKKLGDLDNRRTVVYKKRFFDVAEKYDMAMLPSDWRRPVKWSFRKGVPHYATPRWGDYHKIWYAGRGVGEFAWSAIAGGNSKEAQKALEDVILATNYRRTSSCSIIYHLACFYKFQSISLQSR